MREGADYCNEHGGGCWICNRKSRKEDRNVGKEGDKKDRKTEWDRCTVGENHNGESGESH